MQLSVFPFSSLIFDIFTDDIFIAMFANCRNKISIRPKLPSSKFLFDFRDFGKYFSGCYTLNLCYYFRWTIHWNRLHQKMCMISFCAYFQKVHFITLRNFYTYFFQKRIHFLIDYRMPVFRPPQKNLWVSSGSGSFPSE